MKLNRPEPHPLDFDWRFTAETTKRLSKLAKTNGNVLAIGAPSIAEFLEASNHSVILIDRQPVQRVRRHILCDPDTDTPIVGSFNTIITDPPWYPETYYRWLSWAGQVASKKTQILATLWPELTRPSAATEREKLLEWIRTWATVEVHNNLLQYKTPIFELATLNNQLQTNKEINWRMGDLLIIQPHIKPLLEAPIEKKEKWARFVINDYQLALKLQYDNKNISIKHHPNAIRWTWPSVSIRELGRENIGLWSSRNEVAVIDGSYELLDLIEKMVEVGVSKGKKSLIEPGLEALAPLLEWELPYPPFKRRLQWTHFA